MRILAELRMRWRAIAQRSRLDHDLDHELRDHLDREIAAHVARGASPDEARRMAVRDFGGVQLNKEECRRSHGVQLWDDLGADFRYAIRSLGHEPGFALVTILTLGLGIGANMTIFSAIDAVLLKPLGYPAQDRLVELRQQSVSMPSERDDVAPANFADWRRRATDVVRMAAVEPYSRTYARREGPERVRTWLVTEDFFEILGTTPLIGRAFTSEEFTSGREHVLILGYGIWSREFGRDPSVVGRSVVMDTEPFTIVGVMPQGFTFPPGRDVWSPKVFTAEELTRRSTNYYRVVGRLQSNVTIERAQDRLDTVARQLQQEYRRENSDTGIRAVPLKESLVGAARPILLVFGVGVGLLLLVACVNVSNLCLVRLLRREHEFAVRSALGASTGRVRRQILTEGLVLAACGAAAATMLARWSTSALRTVVPGTLPRAEQMTVGWQATAVGCGLAVVTVLAVCVLASSTGEDTRLSARMASHWRTAGRRRRSLQRWFVAAELAMAMILLVTTGLFVRSLVSLLAERRGFRTDNVVAAALFAWQEYPDPGRRASFVKQVIERLDAVSGVEAAGAGSSLPLAERIGPESATFSIPGVPATTVQPPSAQATIITPGYLESLAVPLRQGRAFTWFDDARTKSVAIINERFARQYWPQESPIGRRVIVRFAGPPVVCEIVGVVGDVKRELSEPAPPALYLPHAQSPTGSITFVVHTTRDAVTLLPQIRAAIAGQNRSIALTTVMTLEGVLHSTIKSRQFNLQLIAFFAAASLLLATIGAYGVMAYATNERMKEISIRIALGGQAGDVMRVVLADGLKLAAAGVAAGLTMAATMSRLVHGMLYGITPLDAPTYASAAFVVIVIAMAACALPAWRATRADVLTVLRAD